MLPAIARRRSWRAGFIMIFTMVAVAISGYLLIESAPDFSNYALLSRSTELDDSLALLRRAVASQPASLYTTLGDLTSPDPDNAFPLPEYYFLGGWTNNAGTARFPGRLEQMIVQPAGDASQQSQKLQTLGLPAQADGQNVELGTPPLGDGGTAGPSQRPTFLSTVPADPYTPPLNWWNPATKQGLYWTRSYNMVRDPTFARSSFKEAFVEDSFDIFFTLETGFGSSAKGQIWKVSPLGVPVPVTYVSLTDTDDVREPRVSPEGSRLLYLRRRPGTQPTGYDVWTASVDPIGTIGSKSNDGQIQVRITTGTQQIFDTARWSALGDLVLYRNIVSHTFEVKGLEEQSVAYKFPGVFPSSYPAVQVFNPSWSPDGRYLAYIAQVHNAQGGLEYRLGVQDFLSFVDRWKKNGHNDALADQNTALDSSRVIDPSGTKTFGTGVPAGLTPVPQAAPPNFKARLVTPSWSPSGGDLVYVADDGTATGTLATVNVISQASYELPPAATGNAGGFLSWLPGSVQGSSNTTSQWLLLARQSGGAGPAGIFRRRLDDGTGTEYPSLDAQTSPDAAAMTDVTSIAVSVAGTKLCYPSSDGQKLWIASIDGADTGFGATLAVFDVSKIPGNITGKIQCPAIGPVRSYWSGPAASVSVVDSTQVNKFDPNGWRDFVSANGDYDGDMKFGTQWLRIEPTARGDSILFDNGTGATSGVYLASRADPTHASFLGGSSHVEACWSPGGQMWTGRENKAQIPGDRPVNIFRVPFASAGSATTIRITTGFEPAVSPDDAFVVVSKQDSYNTTSPPDRTAYPIENMDLVLVNTSGSATPPDKVLTPGTPASQEREPAWSPDGRYIYYQREVQEAASLAQHGSSIYRITRDGAVQVEVQGMTTPGNGDADFISGISTRIEYYSPAVSPDGTRLAFIGKQRLRSTAPGLGESGDLVSEALYVKDLLLGGAPKVLLRFANRNHPICQTDSNYRDEGQWSLESPSWTPNGEELILLRYRDGNQRANFQFPKFTIYNWDPMQHGVFYAADRHDSSGNGGGGFQEIIRVRAADPAYLTDRRSTAKNYDVILSTVPGSASYLDLGANKPEARIFHPRYAPAAACYQRVVFSAPQVANVGISMGDLWYILSGFVRTSSGTGDIHAAQMMIQVLDGSGLLVDQARATDPVFETGVVDVGAAQWTRFSQALNFGPVANPGPITVDLLLYSTGSVGSYAEFTGLKLEQAFSRDKLFPTKFGIGWSLFCPNTDSDPRVPEGALFQR